MDPASFTRVSDYEWRIERFGKMRVPGIIYASEALIGEMDEKVREQVTNVACLPGIVKASYAMPDAHWGYGFAIGGVAAFDADEGGVVSAGGVGFDISCEVRCLRTGLKTPTIQPLKIRLAERLFHRVPVGVGSHGRVHLDNRGMNAMLSGGAPWAVEQGWGEARDIDGLKRRLFVHRKGATHAFGPGHPDLPEPLRALGQPVLIGGSMGTASHVLAGIEGSDALAFSSACHGAGRAQSRRQASKRWNGHEVIERLYARGIVVRSPSARGVAEEAPGA
nr:RtcB family protein [Marinobacterium ramblicola]